MRLWRHCGFRHSVKTAKESHQSFSIMTELRSKTDIDIERLTAVWAQATPEARRVFAEVHFAMDGWPSATPIRECDVLNSARWSRK
jgi:hypothetical protein